MSLIQASRSFKSNFRLNTSYGSCSDFKDSSFGSSNNSEIGPEAFLNSFNQDHDKSKATVTLKPSLIIDVLVKKLKSALSISINDTIICHNNSKTKEIIKSSRTEQTQLQKKHAAHVKFDLKSLSKATEPSKVLHTINSNSLHTLESISTHSMEAESKAGSSHKLQLLKRDNIRKVKSYEVVKLLDMTKLPKPISNREIHSNKSIFPKLNNISLTLPSKVQQQVPIVLPSLKHHNYKQPLRKTAQIQKYELFSLPKLQAIFKPF